MHTQMYMLEGSSRWNMNRAHAAVHVSGASQTRIYDVQLKTNLNALSKRVLGCALLPEFIPPGKPTGKSLQDTPFSLQLGLSFLVLSSSNLSLPPN